MRTAGVMNAIAVIADDCVVVVDDVMQDGYRTSSSAAMAITDCEVGGCINFMMK